MTNPTLSTTVYLLEEHSCRISRWSNLKWQSLWILKKLPQ